MSKFTFSGMVAIAALVGCTTVATAAVVVDDTTHNGSFSDNPGSGAWGVVGAPTGWNSSVPYYIRTDGVAAFINAADGASFYNNTGEVVIAYTEYTLQADLGGYNSGDLSVTVTPAISVVATENADGTGTAVTLAQVSRLANSADGYTLTTVTNTGAAASAGIAGYYIQIMGNVPGGFTGAARAYIDNIVVTAEVVPEPATAGLAALGAMSVLLRRRRA